MLQRMLNCFKKIFVYTALFLRPARSRIFKSIPKSLTIKKRQLKNVQNNDERHECIQVNIEGVAPLDFFARILARGREESADNEPQQSGHQEPDPNAVDEDDPHGEREERQNAVPMNSNDKSEDKGSDWWERKN